MKGIVLAAGKGTRLYPITLPVCKPLLPVYDKPLIYYSVATLMQAGIKDILVIVPPGEIDSFANLLGDGSSFGINIEYKEQMVQRGIADAFIIGADFIGSDSVSLMLGDNIFFGPAFAERVRLAANMLKDGATIFGYYVNDPRPFGVVEFDSSGRAKFIEEKPADPRSNYIVPGLYFYDNNVVEIASNVEPSARGELEITSVNTAYLEKEDLQVVTLGEEYSWFDAGTADNLYEAAGAIRKEQMESGKMIACLEEISLENGWISEKDVLEAAERLKKTKYCLIDRKYIYTDRYGIQHLTHYAREHMDECCLVFERVYQKSVFHALNGILRKGVGKGRQEIRYRKKDGTSAVTEEGRQRMAMIRQHWADKAAVELDFNQMLVELMQRRRMTIGQLAEATGLSRETIKRMRNDRERVFQVQDVVAVSIALSLPPEVSRQFLLRAPCGFLNTDEMHAYQYMLTEGYLRSVPEVNRMLVEMGVRPLTNLVAGFDEAGVMEEDSIGLIH